MEGLDLNLGRGILICWEILGTVWRHGGVRI